MGSERKNYNNIDPQKDWFDDWSEEEQMEIEIGINQAEKGEFTDHKEVMKVFLKYKTKQ
ncbi:hypothetical protein [Flavobacterium poyangense]|uniref:hypothetical protein n=1 Tax=Flavobacterium poyangense TaxID=2204302 RepID=UPI001421D8C5|nr:hypothetical protein [Flavobacterium sp. JXAS1]